MPYQSTLAALPLELGLVDAEQPVACAKPHCQQPVLAEAQKHRLFATACKVEAACHLAVGALFRPNIFIS